MTNNEYLRYKIDTSRRDANYSYNEENIFNTIKRQLESSYNNLIGATWLNPVTINVQQSGSRAKGTAIKGKSDIDMFVSIYDPNNFRTLEQHFDAIYSFVKKTYNNVRKQNVSVGLIYSGFDVDIVPAKRVNSNDFDRKNDHYLWSTKSKSRILTNIQTHINTVRMSGLQDEMILTKLWACKHNIDISSFYLELLAIEALKDNKAYSLEKDFYAVLRYIWLNLASKKIVDPANSNNIISDSLTYAEKQNIEEKAKNAMDATSWSDVV